MPSSTSFLSLTLPELNEFVDSWNVPLNANFETLDDWLEDLHKALVAGSPSTTTWDALRGSLSSLAARLDVSINDDGTLDVSGSSDILDMATSAVRGTNPTPSPRDRLNDGDFEIYDARQPVADGRFVPFAAGGPSAGFPPEELDAGIAVRCADYVGDSGHPIASPRIPWAPGLVTGGAGPLISGTGSEGEVLLSVATVPAVFNIDGYIFRIRETIQLNWMLLTPADGAYIWIYVERVEVGGTPSGYNDPNFRYGSGVAIKDLRILQNGTDGITSGSTFSSALALFDTIDLGKIKEGDVLVIEGSGPAAGDYVIDALDGSTPDTKLTIKGTFKADASGLTWHIQDDAHPNIGAVETDLLTTTQPPFAPGRVYIGRVKHNDSADISEPVTFTYGGVYDSGWGTATAATIASLNPFVHNLGEIPSQIDIWVRLSPTGRVYKPMVERQVLTNFDEGDATVDTGDAKKATLLFPSLRAHASNTEIDILLANESLDPAEGPSLYTDSAGAEVPTGQIRIIARL